MKKLTAILLALVLLFAISTAAMADDDASSTPLLSWMTVRRVILQNELDGCFCQIADLDCDIWVPDMLEPLEEVPEHSCCAFGTEDGYPIITVNQLALEEGTELEDIEEMLPDRGCVSDGIFWINDLYALVYENEAEDSLSALVLLVDGGAVEFVFSPISNQDVYSLSSLILASIQRHTLDIEDAALMMDADLDGLWGENRDVRITETDEGEDEIRIFLWDDGVDSEAIQSINNWDELKEDKIAIYNNYAEALAEFGMDDLILTLMYISPEEDLSFLTISDGEIVYDIFEGAA